MAAVARAEVDGMAGAIHAFLYSNGAAAFVHQLPPDDLNLLSTTHIAVVDTPSARDLALVGVPRGSMLLGLYTTPPALIQVFADGVLATKRDAVDVFSHELGHRFGFDHSTHPVSTGLFVAQDGSINCTSFHPENVAPTGWPDQAESSGDREHDESCPFCRLHARTAEVQGLAEGLRRLAWLAAQPTTLPLGLGGTVPLMRRKSTEAHDALLEAATLLPDRQGEVRDLDRLLHNLQESLQGHVTTEETSAIQQAAYAAWFAAFRLNHAWWLHLKHPEVTDIHDLV